jgi:V/A-type H+-transporting ATPase subunit C
MEKSFYYAVGRIRGLEAKLLSGEQVARMAAATNFESAFAVLSETIYAETLPHLTKPFDFEDLCLVERKRASQLVKKLAPEDRFVQSFLAEDDQSLNYFKKLKSLAREYSRLLKTLINYQLDLLNLKLLLRAQSLKKDQAFLAAVLVEPGLIERASLLALLDQNPAEIAQSLSYTPYFPALAAGLEAFASHRTFYLLEKLMADFILAHLSQAKYKASGIEPLIGYFLAKESELKTIRLILVAKTSQLPTDQIKSRLRSIY